MLTAELVRFRRRLCVVAAARYAGVLVPAALVLGEIATLAWRPAPWGGVMLGASAIGGALILSIVAAIVRAPSVRGTARVIDRRLGLQDRTITAVQVLDKTDPMSQLVVLDAARRIGDRPAWRTFPLERPAHFRTVLAAAGGASVVFLWMTARPPSFLEIERGGTSRPAPAGGTQAAQAPRPAAGSAASSPTGSAAETALSSRSAIVSKEVAAQPVAAAAPKAGTTHGGPMPATGSRGISSGSDARVSARTFEGVGGSGGGEDPRSRAGARDADGAATARDGGRGAAGLPQGATAAAGGVGGAFKPAVGPGRPDPVRPAKPERETTYAARYRAAAARAEAAIAQERVPAGLRTYVKNYFVAIRP